VVNAGDGAHEHPTQALLDCLTITEKRGSLDGLSVLIVGDIRHSRVARSNIIAMGLLGAKVSVCGPATLIPEGIEQMGATVVDRLDDALPGVDVIMVLRIQKERMGDVFFPSMREYSRRWGINPSRLARTSDDVLIMHPGPVNRGLELDPAVADGPWSVIMDQVTNGVAVRMAILYLLAGWRDRTHGQA
jgi:aspartate carbamoyltransferase catalytic subunit